MRFTGLTQFVGPDVDDGWAYLVALCTSAASNRVNWSVAAPARSGTTCIAPRSASAPSNPTMTRFISVPFVR